MQCGILKQCRCAPSSCEESVAEALFRVISRVGIPKEILTDQGTAFMSRTLSELYNFWAFKSYSRTSVYHPQTDGLVEAKCDHLCGHTGSWGARLRGQRTDRGGACQIYHLNLLNAGMKGTSVGLAAAVSMRIISDRKRQVKSDPLALVSGGNLLSPLQLADLAQLQADFVDVYFTPAWSYRPCTAPYRNAPREGGQPYRLPEHKKKVVQEELKAMLDLGVI